MRLEKRISIKDSVDRLKDGMVVGLSGFSYMNPPMGFVREIIRQKKKDLTIVSGPTSGIETDMLIGAGCVKKVVTAGVAFERIAGIAPNFRKAAEEGRLDVWECDEAIWHMGLKAAIYDVPYMLWKAGTGSSIPLLNKEIQTTEIGGKKYLKVPKIKPDISFLHMGLGDKYGNIQTPQNIFLGRVFCERLIAEATQGDVFVSVERIIPNSEIVKNAERTILRNVNICENPNGAHPGACNGFYIPDLGHYNEYVRSCKDGRFEEYLERYVYPEKYPIRQDLNLMIK
ncbi:hypothetical protein KY366_00920 [Candidatus Woesearchaeota archaeon]|nr:hypothetical protein [Candidatus Woesearchaeota archaeon]